MQPAELGHAVAADGTHLADAEDAVLVAVERDRLAPILQIGAGRMEERYLRRIPQVAPAFGGGRASPLIAVRGNVTETGSCGSGGSGSVGYGSARSTVALAMIEDDRPAGRAGTFLRSGRQTFRRIGS
jgi:hypothetical protein